MPKEDNKILKYNNGENSMKVPFIIYADLESLLYKIIIYHNNPKKTSITEINEHMPSGYSFCTHSLFDTTKNRFDYHRGKNCMKNLYLDLRQHATEIINYEKKEMISLTNEEKKYIMSKKLAINVKKDLVLTMTIKNIIKSEIVVIILENIGELFTIFVIRCKTPKEIPAIFPNGSTYDYHFIIKELAEECKGHV